MEIIRVKTLKKAEKAFEIIKEGMNKGAKVLGLATGSTPVTLYKEMTSSDLDFSEMTSVNLDEYVGLGGSDEQSYRHFMDVQLFDKNHSKKRLYQMEKQKIWKQHAKSMIKSSMHIQSISKS